MLKVSFSMNRGDSYLARGQGPNACGQLQKLLHRKPWCALMPESHD
jgi:hypothetical protein